MGEDDELGVVVDVERAIGPLRQGWRKLGINMGGFWMLDVVRAVLEQIGPASLSVTSYACGAVDAQTLVWLRETGRVTDLRLVVDRAMIAAEFSQERQRVLLSGMIPTRFSRMHCKIAVLRNAEWDIAIHGSANMNANPRWEQWALETSPEAADFFEAVIDQAFACHAEADNETNIEAGARAREMFAQQEQIEAERAIQQERVAQMQGPRDAGAQTAVEYWAGRLNATTVATGLAIELGHTSTATAWEKLAHAARVKLEEAQKRARADERRDAVRRARR